MNEFGNLSLSLAWFLSLTGTILGLYSAYTSNRVLTLVTKQKLLSVTLTTLVSLFALAYLFLTDDYSNQYVWQTSSKNMPWGYKVTAIWGGMDGSMLLWAGILSVSTLIVALRFNSYPKKLMSFTLPVLHSNLLFFLTILLFFTNPFRYINADFIPAEGNGLNPLLQNPYMAIHPPMLYLGFTTFAIPFALCVGALLANELKGEWIKLSRTWSLVAFGFLTTGIVLGGHWAYLELGWGGFWAWDPVENASFLPWLTATAYLHSVMVQERKGMLKFWNVWLIIITYSLTVFGTFLTRSGIVQSVHAFASTDIGYVFLNYLAFILLVCIVLTIVRRKELKAERVFESILSRESAFFINNLLLLSICFATLWGVMFPVFSEAFTGVKQNVGIPYFNKINIPLFLLLLTLMGIGPMLAWRKTNPKKLIQTFVVPLVFAFLLSILCVYAGAINYYPSLSYGICAFVFLTIITELRTLYKTNNAGSVKEKLTNFKGKISKHRRRYGAYTVHLGIILMAVSITASMAHKFEKEFSLKIGDELSVGRFNLKLTKLYEHENKNYRALRGEVALSTIKNNEVLDTLKPEVRFYTRKAENTTEVAIRMGPKEDVYLVLAGTDETGQIAAFKVFINPLQIWLWVGTLISIFGTLILILPAYKKA